MEGQSNPPTNSIGPNQGAEVSLPPSVEPGKRLRLRKTIQKRLNKELEKMRRG
jgi:hypothetical protein